MDLHGLSRHLGAHTLVKQLMSRYPTKAAEILVRHCQSDPSIQHEIMVHMAMGGDEHGEWQREGTRSLSKRDAQYNASHRAHATESQSSGSHRGSQHSGPSHAPQRAPQRFPPGARPHTPVSSHSTSSLASSHSKTNSGEWILTPTMTAKGLKEKAIRMEFAPIPHSVIRENVIHERKLTAELCPADVDCVTVPHMTDAETCIDVPISYSIELTWRRPTSQGSHDTTFYVVQERWLNTDILLGYEDSGEMNQGHQPVDSTQTQRPRGLVPDQQRNSVPPHAPDPPAPSHHRSDMYIEPTHLSPMPYRPSQNHHQFVSGLAARQQAFRPSVESVVAEPRPSSASTIRGQLHPLSPMRLSASPSEAESKIQIKRLRLIFVWDITTMKLWLELSKSSETFFETFRQVVEERKGIFDRSGTIILLKTEEETPDAEAYSLSLEEEDLKADWEDTIKWLMKNKRDNPPRVYGRVQVGEG